MNKALIGKDLAGLSIVDLKTKLTALRKEFFSLRVAKTEGGRAPANTNRLSVVQKDIARVLTFIRKLQIEEVKGKYKDATYKPIVLRKHQTKKARLSLTLEQKTKRVASIGKKMHAFPKLKFALK